MIPESLATLYAFLALVAPGLVYQYVRERNRPALRESAFREASRVALTSLIWTTAAVAIMIMLGIWWPQAFADASAWLASDDYLAANLGLAVRTALIEVTLACLLGYLGAKIIYAWRPASSAQIAKTGVWYQLFTGAVPHEKAAWVLAELTDGTLIWGYVDQYTVDETGDDRDISFCGPGLKVVKKGAPDRGHESYWSHVIVRASTIASIKVAYENAATEKRPTAVPDRLARSA